MKNKPIYLWPSVIVYKIIKLIILLPLHYLTLGFFFSFYFVFNTIIDGLIFIARLWYRFLKHFFIGLFFPFIWLHIKLTKDENKEVDILKAINARDAENHNKKLEKIRQKEEEKLAKTKANYEKLQAKKAKEAEEQEQLEREKELEEQRRLIEQERINEAKAKDAPVRTTIVGGFEEKPQEENKVAKTKAEIKKEKKQRKKELEAERKRLQENNNYVNENAQIEKKTLGDHINDGLENLIKGPKNLIKNLKEKYQNSIFLRNKRNEESMQREALLIDFNGEDAEKSDKKVVYEYVGKNPEGKVIKGYFEAFSRVEVHSYLLAEGFEVYSIKTDKWIQLFHSSKQVTNVKVKTKDLIFFITQLSTYIKAGIPLVESLRILSRQFTNSSYKRLFDAVIYDLTMGDNFSDAMAKQGEAFPRILVNMVKASEMTGELPETLDDMANYFTESDKTRKQMITAMTYPTIIFVLAVLALGFIMIYIVPKFTAIYEGMDNAELPGITIFITNLSNFLKSNYIYIIIVAIVVLFIFRYLYKNVKLFRTLIQYLLMHTPVIKNIIIYNEVTMFTKTFASLLKHNVFITDTMEILNKITNNEIWKMIILDTITNLAKGEKISKAFEGHWAVPIPAYEMIVTGERTGQLPEMMQKVSDYYQELHKNAVGRIKSFVEPILILFLTGVVGVIVLSIVIPMFGMYDNIQ